jgi:hypothetical protein
MLDFPRIDAIVEAGYRHAEAILAAPPAELASALAAAGTFLRPAADLPPTS